MEASIHDFRQYEKKIVFLVYGWLKELSEYVCCI